MQSQTLSASWPPDLFLLLSSRGLLSSAIPSFVIAFFLWKVTLSPWLSVIILLNSVTAQLFIHSRRDRGTVPRAPHLIPWIGNLKALLFDPVTWLWQMHEKYVGCNCSLLISQLLICLLAGRGVH
jgi:hypothetical protein